MSTGLRPRADADLLPERRALESSFASLRSAKTTLSAARVRAAVRWSAREEERRRISARRWGRIAGFGRLAEASLALGATAFLFVGLGSAPAAPAPQPAAVTQQRSAPAADDSERFVRWMRTGALGPFEPLQNEVRLRGGAVDRVRHAPDPEPADDLITTASLPR